MYMSAFPFHFLSGDVFIFRAAKLEISAFGELLREIWKAQLLKIKERKEAPLETQKF